MSKMADELFEPAHAAVYGAGVLVAAWVLSRIASGPSEKCNTVLGRLISDSDVKVGAKCMAANVIMDGYVLFMILGGIMLVTGAVGLVVGWKSLREEEPEHEQ